MATHRLTSPGGAASERSEVRLPLGPTSVDRSASIGELILAVLRRRFEQLLAHQAGARLGDDLDEVHDMRVAARRIRTLLGIFPETFPRDAAAHRAEFTWVAGALGAVRDLDVQIEQRSHWTDAVERVADLAPLLAELENRRVEARAHLTDVIDSERYQVLMSAFADAISESTSLRSPSTEAAVSALPPVLGRLWGDVRTSGRKLQPDSSPESFHRLRIRAKRLRYGTETASELFGRPATSLIRRLIAVQDMLGAHQDAQVFVAHLRSLATDPSLGLEPPSIYAMGELAAHVAGRGRELRESFEEPFARLQPAWKRLKKAMQAA
jgi:triphosphatase